MVRKQNFASKIIHLILAATANRNCDEKFYPTDQSDLFCFLTLESYFDFGFVQFLSVQFKHYHIRQDFVF